MTTVRSQGYGSSPGEVQEGGGGPADDGTQGLLPRWLPNLSLSVLLEEKSVLLSCPGWG